ncbi:MAG: nucleoside deaminase [Clostridiales bacterium]|nr:nucleoside deaminase [Clostridiales bacterium]
MDCVNSFEKGTHEWFMFEAYLEAMCAYNLGECPVGAVIVKDKEIIARAHNNKELNKDPVGHAEVLSIHKACDVLGDWRLNDCDMYVTLEPCLMCAGALVLARVRKVYIGARDLKAGAVDSVFNVLDETRLNHRVDYEIGLLEDLSSNILKKFFKQLRLSKKICGEVSKWS